MPKPLRRAAIAIVEAAERCFARAESFEQAANAVDQRAQLTDKPRDQAVLFAKAADYLTQANDHDTAIVRLEQAADLDPNDAAIATVLEQRYNEAGRLPDLAIYLLKRAEKVADKELRVALRKRTAYLQRDQLNDPEASRASLVLLWRTPMPTLTLLADDADQRGGGRRGRIPSVGEDRRRFCRKDFRHAGEAASSQAGHDAAGAIERYEQVPRADEKTSTPERGAEPTRSKTIRRARRALERLLRRLEREVKPTRPKAEFAEGPLDDTDRRFAARHRARDRSRGLRRRPAPGGSVRARRRVATSRTSPACCSRSKAMKKK
jgi:tetratricopeptide (TPR) repeat protein